MSPMTSEADMNEALYKTLRGNVSYLGRLLGETVSDANGPEFLDKIELIRRLSKSARGGNEEDSQRLEDTLLELRQEELLPVSRAFNQFLNLANIADQHHTISREMAPVFSAGGSLVSLFTELKERGESKSAILNAVRNLDIELVLTAHPTEITRRTLIHKYGELDACLGARELQGRTEGEEQALDRRLRELIAQIWHTDDFRHSRPTPVDEAKWGFAVVENSLWDAVPEFIRRLDDALLDSLGHRLPLDADPIRFSSWMGGDRDGNPNVTAKVTEEVLLLSRWQAADLYIRELDELVEELSMSACSRELEDDVGQCREPYRVLLRRLRERLRSLRHSLAGELRGEGGSGNLWLDMDDLWRPLSLCYRSLHQQGMTLIANGRLLDLLRRVRCFGVHLVKLDIRQDSDRHTAVLVELTAFLGLGDYSEWSEAEKQQFLVAELASKRPLIPRAWQPSDEVREVLNTLDIIARQPPGALACYIISMARQPSDILAVELLLKASGVGYRLPVVPLFETLDDLNRARDVVTRLLDIPWYKDYLADSMMVMIGYSDSAKDAGMMAAAWAQYRAQESLVNHCRDAGVKLRLFHGRGGTIGRGGAPAHDALLSQPPGSLAYGLRVTEQGEMIRTKLGLTGLAINTLALYTSAILQANLCKPPSPKQAWRDVMDKLADSSCGHYRALVRDNPDFVDYFREATPEQELAKLPLGSRPARRKKGGGISSLRAIPWIFAWMQNRLMLPAWLGAGQALAEIMADGGENVLQDMNRKWPFFATRLSMLEMVFAKSDIGLSQHYDSKLVSTPLKYIGEQLRQQLRSDIAVVLRLMGQQDLLEHQQWGRESIQLRNIYTDPLNVLQVELLERNRRLQDDVVEQALMVTIAGVAAGMRNTG
jgi:phosphoenolpyruvate carboxylase